MGARTKIKQFIRLLKSWRRGQKLDRSFPEREPSVSPYPNNDLRDYFDRNLEGPGIWKWEHYFQAYGQHLSKFRGKSPTIVEIGVYSGGSLGMWQSYFGPGARIIGIDIEPACKVYERDGISIVIGDQEDRNFWSRFRNDFPNVDVLIDDGGHSPEQQSVTLEEMLPHMAPGGVYICEDIHGKLNSFAGMVFGLADGLNGKQLWDSFGDAQHSHERRNLAATALQKAVKVISLYPFVTVFELHDSIPSALFSTKRGTEWQPFYDRQS